MSSDFSPDQKRYLEGFVSGLSATRVARAGAPARSEPIGPDAIHLKAQDRTVAAGGKLCDQEKIKREEHPFDAYPRLVRQAEMNEAPKPPDNFRWRYYGIFYVAPTQSSYMCRLRIPNGILKYWQFAGVADLAENFGGPYAHVTTRANLQLREIEPKNAINVIEGLQDLGLCSRGSGADNIRNVTGTSTAGIDPQELLDTRPYARAWHFHILNDRSLYGLPRKFNVAFDGAGCVATLEETNDIAFQAVEVCAGFGVDAGIYFRLGLGGITGHKDFARDTGVILKPQEAVSVADAILRVFIENGDRTNRNKARLKYVLDAWGFDKFLVAVEEKLGRKLARVPAEAIAPRPAYDRLAHIGIHPQKQAGLNWIGVALKLGRLSPEQMRALAKIAAEYGDGDIRLTVWQNLLISGVANINVATVVTAIETLGLAVTASALRAGLVACTGATGCRFAAAHTKENAEEIASWCEPRVPLSAPVNVHLTGCHHSCAQHYIGDIGLIGARVPINDEGDTVDGYHLLVGGGFGADAAIARELFRDVKAADAPQTVERVLKAYLANRASETESFLDFAKRTDIDAFRHMTEMEVA
ncbi:NirA family protein [Afipia felis]|uniref:Sulfite reductase [ferredoxin] n=2 Tax=Afipia felis TaxID=1035 RepID=A0A380W7Y4_AFIFE|nr:NirA family protein [Afipia felis]EKS28200.1 precorrin-3B synthase [Afipia felis ATCC 53690]SUU76910.1 Sulfite reductase [ferredoxin] [Afipia felis]SUU84976.1 Sulfite reductase [ferredoxin] [Afipia felis]